MESVLCILSSVKCALNLLVYGLYTYRRNMGRGGGPTTTKKRSCRREKPEMSFVFFVLFQNTFKIEVFVPDLVKNVSSKMNKKDRKI